MFTKAHTTHQPQKAPAVHLPARREWHSLPGEFFRSEEIYQRELAHIWQSAWLFACPECEIAKPGRTTTAL